MACYLIVQPGVGLRNWRGPTRGTVSTVPRLYCARRRGGGGRREGGGGEGVGWGGRELATFESTIRMHAEKTLLVSLPRVEYAHRAYSSYSGKRASRLSLI